MTEEDIMSNLVKVDAELRDYRMTRILKIINSKKVTLNTETVRLANKLSHLRAVIELAAARHGIDEVLSELEDLL